MSKPPGSDNPEELFLDNLIALAQDIVDLTNQIKAGSDEPEVLYRALKIESAALIIQHRSRNYRPRLKLLKKLALLQTNGDIRSALEAERKKPAGQGEPFSPKEEQPE